MFLSIIIPVHNTEKYIRDCLDSCLAQDIERNDYEIICVDDCSTDNSVEILREYEKNNENIRVILLSENRGVSAARNAGIECMRGDFCMFLDSDDYIADNCLSRLKHILSMSDKKTIVCVGRYHFTESGFADRRDNNVNVKYFGCPTEGYITNRLIPSAFASMLRFQENIVYGEDEVFCLELTQFKPTIVKSEEPIYYYRRHGESAMAFTPEKEKRQFESVVNAMIYIKNKYGYDCENIRNFVRERIGTAFNYITKQSPGKNRELRRKLKSRGLSYPSANGNACYSIDLAYFKYRLSRLTAKLRVFPIRCFSFVKRLLTRR